MDRLTFPPRLMVVSDLDYTMVDHCDPENVSLFRFNALWESKYRHDSLLVFSTGRSPALYKELRKEKPILTPDITIMSVGTEITYGKTMIPDESWAQLLNRNWDRNIVSEETKKFSELALQPETEQRPHKLSFMVDKERAERVMKRLLSQLENRGLSVKIIYSGGMDLDVVPEGAGKGQALAYLHKRLRSDGKQPKNTLVCGDSGNDAELFSVPDVYGVMVGNAQEELLKWYAENGKGNDRLMHGSVRCAAAIVEAIGSFCLGPSSSPRDDDDVGFQSGEECSNPSRGLVEFYLLYERWRRGEIDESPHRVEEFLDPVGVSVCASGMEIPFSGFVDVLRNCYGDMKGKRFRVWLDRLLPTKIGPDTWCVLFDKWEAIGDTRNCYVTTAIMKSKVGSNGSTILHIHHTLRDGHVSGHVPSRF